MITEEIKIEGAKLILRNFSGVRKEYNEEGNRNFGVLLTDEHANQLASAGWNIKYLNPRPDDPTQHRQPWLKVKVKYGKISPIANLITTRGRTRLDENTIGQLDYARYKWIDLIVRPYNYPASNLRPAGTAAYLKAIYVTLQEDDFASKYADIPEASPIVQNDYGSDLD